MRIVLISHSNIHPRQQRFAEELSKHASVLCVMPSMWGGLKPVDKKIRDGGHVLDYVSIPVSDGGIYQFMWHASLFVELRKFRPDVIYCASEWNSNAALQLESYARSLECGFVLFTWENIHKPDKHAQGLLNRCALVVCGNLAAMEIVKSFVNKVVILDQVGVDVELFCPRVSEVLYDVISIGRNVPEKGGDMIEKAFRLTKFVSTAAYESLPGLLNSSRVHVSFPFDTEQWCEQSMGYVTAEAMSCGLPVITSDCGAILEHLGLSRAKILLQKDVESLKGQIQDYLDNPWMRERDGSENREFILKHYSNVVIAKKLIKELRMIL